MYKYIINRINNSLNFTGCRFADGMGAINRKELQSYITIILLTSLSAMVIYLTYDLHSWENSGSIPFHSVIQQTVLMQSLQCTDSWVTNFACIEPHITLYQFDLPPEFGFRCLWRMAQSPNSLCNSLLFIVL